MDRNVRRLIERIRALEVSALAQNLPQLGNSSVEDGGITEYDALGNLASRFGKQHDDSHATVVYTGPIPPIPSGLTAEGGQVAATLTWDGSFFDALVSTMDWSRLEVHASTAGADFEVDSMPGSATRVGSIESAAGGSLTFAAQPGDLWLKAISRSAAGKVSEASSAVHVTVLDAVDQAIIDQLHSDLDAAGGRLATAEQELADAQRDLYEDGGRVDTIKSTLTGQIVAGDQATLSSAATTAQQKADAAKAAATAAAAADATAKADKAKADAEAAAALDAKTKADAAQAAALAAAKTYAEAEASGASADALATAKADAQAKADAAKAAAISAAALDAKAKADAAQSAATTAAAADAKTKADAAKADAISAAALDATAKADAAKSAAITAAASDATTKANDAKSAAQAAAATDAQAKADAAKAAATATAAADAKTKADAAQAAAISAAATTAQLKADGAKQAAIDAAAITAQQKADAAKAAATTAAAADATAKADAAKAAATTAAAADATTKANNAKQAAIDALSPALSLAQTKASDAMTAAQAAQATADGAITSYYQEAAPWADGSSQPASKLGDMWYRASTNQAYRWDGSKWQVIADTSITAAMQAAQGAQATADGKISAYYQPTRPTTGDLNDLWFDMANGNKPYYCSKTSPLTWTLVQDKSIADGDAATLASAKTDAQAKSDAAKAAAIAAAAADAKSKADAAQAAATTAAAADAKAKADQAEADALAAAKTYAAAQASGASADALAAAKADAQSKADAAKAAAISAAAADAKAKADAAQAAATAAAALDAKAKADAVAAEAQSRGADLVTNGTGYLGTNRNFTNLNFVPSDAPPGAVGSFITKGLGYPGGVFSDDLIPVNPSKKYQLSCWVRETASTGASKFYAGYACYDAAGNSISPIHYLYVPATSTTLAAPLNPGDTTVTLASSTGWPTAAPFNNLIIWNYTDPGGRLWPVRSYSRNVYAIKSISGTVVTLNSAYTGPAAPAGTAVNQSLNSSNYQYAVASLATAPTTWTQFTSGIVTGIQDGGVGVAVTKFTPGTANVKFLLLPQYNTSAADARQAFGGISMSEAGAAQATADDAKAAAATAASKADAAQSAASGKNQILSGTTDPVGVGKTAGDIWQKYTLTNNVMRIVATWRWSGSKWESQALDEKYIPQLDIGVGTYGELDGLRLKAKSVQAGNILVEGSVGNVLIENGAIKAEKLNVQDVTAAVAKIIQLDVTQLTVASTAAINTAVIDKLFVETFAVKKITANQIDVANIAAAVGEFVKIKAENVEAGNVVAPLIVAPGGSVVAGDPDGANASMESDGFHTYAVDPDGNQYESSRLGSSDGADYQEMRPGPNQPASYSVSSRGDVAAKSLTSQEDLTVGGMPLLGTLLDPSAAPGVLDGFGRGASQIINFQPKLSVTISDGATVAVAMAAVNINPGRVYQVSLPWKVNITPSSGTGSTSNVPYSVRLHYEIGPQGGTPDPTQSSATFMYTNQRVLPVASNYDGVLLTNFITPEGSTPLTLKVLLVFSVVRGSLTPDLVMPLNWMATVADMGSSLNARVITASSPGSTAVSTFTSTWSATDSRSWNTDGVVYHPDGTTTGAIRQGLAGSPARQWFGAFSCGGKATSGETDKTIAQALAGASIVSAKIFVQLTWSPPNADYKSQIKMRPLAANSVPSTMSAPTGASPVVADFPGTVGIWIPVPTSWFSASNNGAVIASPDWLFPNTNCVFAGATAPAGQRPAAQITYTR